MDHAVNQIVPICGQQAFKNDITLTDCEIPQ